MMDGLADFIIATSNPVIIKPGQIIATAVQIDSVEMLPDMTPDDDKSIQLTESVFTCVEKRDNFSDQVMEAEEEGFDLDMEIVEATLSSPKAIPNEKLQSKVI